ncbi:MAG: glycosyltransferase, partial [Chloroflexi bacterium]|nr:glycosyltransferase [Chloroflexota bacterium]
SGVKYSVRAEYGNFMLSLIRSRFADRVIYQSQFIRKWWEDWYGVAKAPATVIINGVDLNAYTHEGGHERPTDKYRMLLLEGSLARGLNSGLFHAVSVAEKMSAKYPMEVVVAGVVDEATQGKLNSLLSGYSQTRPFLPPDVLCRSQPALPQLCHRSIGLRLACHRLR